MAFWEFEINTFDVVILVGILAIVLLISNIIRRKIGLIRKSLLPTAVIGGILMLILKTIGLFDNILNIDSSVEFLEAVTYHGLGLGVIAVTLKTSTKSKERQRKIEVVDAGLVTVSTYSLQAIVGVGISLLLYLSIQNNLFAASGLLLPLGFGQGSGQALSFGKIFENDYGFIGGASFGLTIAAVGFLVACIVGVLHIIFMKKRGRIKFFNEQASFVSNEVIASPNEVPVTESVDRLTIQISLIFLVYFATFLFMYSIEKLPLGNFGTNTLKPLIWGFNFLIGSLFGVLLNQVLKLLKRSNLMTRDYPNNYLLNRISGFMFDLMIIAGIAAIQINVLKSLILPLIIICLIGLIATYFYVRFITYYLFPKYPEEAFVSLFGMLTGTTSTGMILLREVDPKFETPAANNLVYQSFYALAFGFPLFLLLGFAPKGLTQTLISLVIISSMFMVFNIVIFRRKIF